LCGRPIRGKAHRVMIAGAILSVCSACAKYGVPVKSPVKTSKSVKGVVKRRYGVRRPSFRFEDEFEVVEDFSKRIREAREALGWTKEILAERVKEKVSVIRRIEAGEMLPTLALARKLEHILKIKLLERVPEYSPPPVGGRSSELTLGDVAEIKFKKKR